MARGWESPAMLNSIIKTEIKAIIERCNHRIFVYGVFLQKSVRLVVNYLRTQKAVVRVSPEVPLQSILPVICAKCEVNPDHVVLLRDNVAGEELELSKSLNELGIKELYAWDNRRGEAHRDVHTLMHSASDMRFEHKPCILSLQLSIATPRNGYGKLQAPRFLFNSEVGKRGIRLLAISYDANYVPLSHLCK